MRLAHWFGLRPRQVIPHLATLVPVAAPAPRLASAGAPLEPARMIEADALRRVRQARGWSSPALAAAVTARRRRTEGPRAAMLTSDDIDAAEQGRASRVPYLLSRLDLELGLDGRSCLELVRDVQQEGGRFTITFPGFWVGHVWLAFTDAMAGGGGQRAAAVTLTWGPWRRRLEVAHEAVVTTRRGSEGRAGENNPSPLVVEVPAGWQVRAGLGLPPGAHDVGEGWGAAGLVGILKLLRSSLAAAETQIKREGSGS